ncbi:MAG: DMT family transporter [Acidiferrobacterales bacterium]
MAALWMAGAIISFSALAVGVRELSTQISIVQILFWRGVVGLVIVSVIINQIGWHHIYTRDIRLHALRNTIHFAGQYAWFFGLAAIPLAEVFAIEFTTPLWTALLATLFLGEQMSRYRVSALILGLVGIMIILRPGLEVIQPAALVVVFGAGCYGAAHTVTKRLSSADTSWSIIFYMVLMQLPLSTILLVHEGTLSVSFSWPWLIVVSAMALSAHYCMSRALSLADATVVVPIDFLRLPLIALVGYLLYDEKLEWAVVVGSVIMFSGIYLNVKADTGKRKYQVN